MADGADIRRYDKVAITLHWLVALGVFILVGLGWYMVDIPKGGTSRSFFFNLHKSIGVTVGIIVLLRVIWRWNHMPPPLPPGTQNWIVNAAKLSHSLLYALLVLMPIARFVASNFTKYGVTYFGLFKIGPLFAENRTLYELFQGIHHAASEVLVIVVAVHIAAALKHLLVDKDGVFFRILPGGRTS